MNELNESGPSKARYIVGIDLGTTHTALAYAELTAGEEGAAHPRVLAVPQLVAAGSVDARPLLPSFLYSAHETDGPQALPWDEERRFAVGEYARARGADAPARLVGSAKSWLSHSGIDRRAALLPLGAPADVEKISPVEASFRYLEHLVEAWDATIAKGDPALALSEQEVVLTVPASFDAGARELTVEAAMAAGLENVTLLEEPQAALYAWIDALGDSWRRNVKVGDVILVVDVGGGTTDFSAIAALDREGSLELVRVAVGNHILLGGDNMDLALAHLVKAKLASEGKEVDTWQMVALTHACRAAKERLLGGEGAAAVASAPIAVAARGSKLLGGGLRAELTRDEVQRVLVEGYFPPVDGDAKPTTRARGGLTQVGLPYAADPSITRHLAWFLARQAGALSNLEGFPRPASSVRAGALLHPTAVLFNGGVMKAAALRERLMTTLDGWLTADGAAPSRVLAGGDLDLAVAKGAAAYGLARHGKGLRIRGGTARAYYVGIESPAPAVPGVEPPMTALCLAPFGMEEGTAAELPRGEEIGVVVGEPVQFRFFGSTVRRDDQAGTNLERWGEGELEELAPIEVTLPSEGRREGDVVPAHLRASVTEVGTLLLEAVPVAPLVPDERWKIELNIRHER